LAATLSCALGQQPAFEPLTEEQQRRNLESLDLIWTTVRDRHFDPKLIAEIWEKARADMLPAAKAAKTMEEYRMVLRRMLNRLGQSHFAVIPARVYSSIPSAAHSGSGNEVPGGAAPSRDRDDYVTGIHPGIVDGRATVVEVEADSPAAKAGVKTGWWIESIDGTVLQERLAPMADVEMHEKARLSLGIVNSLLEGRSSEMAKIELIDGAGKRIAVELQRIEARGRLVQFGNMPPERVFFESKRIADTVGYVRFSMFADPETLMPQFERAVLDCLACKGFIIDLRGNPGGLGPMAMGMAGWFVRRGRQKLGVMQSPGMTMAFEIYPRGRTFNGPLAVLIDEGSASTSEILAAGLRDIGRARLFGARTAGAALPSNFMRLPNGDGFQYAVASYVSQSGKALEGAGVEPDVAVSHTREALLEGRDRVAEAAVHWIHAQ
jgi:carboxyl-terminal processing protease